MSAGTDLEARVKRLLEGEFRGELHPRDRMGRFRDIVGRLKVGQHVQLPGARVDRRRSGEFVVTNDHGGVVRSGTAEGAANVAGSFSAGSTHPDSLGGAKSYESTKQALDAPQPEIPSAAEQQHMHDRANELDAQRRRELMARVDPAEVEAIRDQAAGAGSYIDPHTAARVADAAKPRPKAVVERVRGRDVQVGDTLHLPEFTPDGMMELSSSGAPVTRPWVVTERRTDSVGVQVIVKSPDYGHERRTLGRDDVLDVTRASRM